MKRNPIVLAWTAGLALAVLVYWVGPERFVFRLLDNLHMLGWRIGEFVADLSAASLDLVRAIAIGVYGTFVVLGLAVLRRGGRAKAMLLVISILFFLLATGEVDGGMPNTRWFAALLLAGAGAAVMTGRLRHAGTVAVRYPPG